MKRAPLVVLLALMVASVSLRGARAQEPTSAADLAPTPGGPAITLHDVEMLFPAGVRFGLILTTAPENLARAALTLSQDGGLIFSVPVDLKQFATPFGESLTRVDYVWPINPALTFAPFSTVMYRWNLTTAGGETLAADGQFSFHDAVRTLDSPAVWRSIDGPIQLYTHNPTLALDLVQTAALRANERATAETGLDRPFRFVIYDPDVTFCQRDARGLYIDSPTIGGLRVACDPQAAAQIYANNAFLVVQRTDFSLESLQQQLVESIVASLYDQLWASGAGDGPPAWFRAGLLQLYGLAAQGWTLPLVRDAVRSGGLLTLADLQRPPNDALESARLWRAQSYLMALYLAARFGAEAPFELAREPLDGRTFDQALSARFGLTPAQFFGDWRGWLLRDEAAAAVRWTPYVPTTATPAPSATPTPARTPTLSVPSVTPPPSATITPFPASSNTPIPPRPTNTPRSPGSVLRPTATPALPPSGGGVCGAPALGLLPLAGLVWIGRRKRRKSTTP